MSATLLIGDWIEQLKTLPDNSVHCVITSPPYWNLRDYLTPGQLGLEKTFDDFLVKVVAGFREIRRVLRSDGTCWLNIGDKNERKEVLGMPWRVALALQADGWYLRCDVIWQKPNPMPESVTDRPTKSHEYIFLLTKSERYFYDAEAVKEPVSGTAHTRGKGLCTKTVSPGNRIKANSSFHAAVTNLVASRNKRSVWTIHTHPYKGAHYATFPPKLVEPCLLAGTSARGCCPHCGAPWKRIVAKGAPLDDWKRQCGSDRNGEYHGNNQKRYEEHKAQPASTVKARILAGMVARVTTGWQPTCKNSCPAVRDALLYEPVPCTVLDPFGGSGTVGMVANWHGRNSILIDLNPENAPLIQERLATPAPAPRKPRNHSGKRTEMVQADLF